MTKIVKYSSRFEFNKFEQYCKWIAVPHIFRTPKTQKELADEIGIHFVTLSKYKDRPDFYTTVAKYKDCLKQFTPLVLSNLLELTKKDSGACRLWLQFVEGFADSSRHSIEVNKEISEEQLQQRIEQLKNYIRNEPLQLSEPKKA